MSILIIGANGSMGVRYQSILRYLEQDYKCADKNHSLMLINKMVEDSDGVIIATPTESHADYIKMACAHKRPILCEKPVTRDVAKLKATLAHVRESRTPFQMMYQYKELVSSQLTDWSYYNYFRHGNDGLVWDCLQIIGLARGEVTLEDTSPIWRCSINGKALDSKFMDGAYVNYVRKWLRNPTGDLGEIVAVHEKVLDYERSHRDGKDDA